jgi:putative spermidine/putrescine transport system permease protein
MLRVSNTLIYIYLLAPIVVVVATAFGTSAYPIFPPFGLTTRWFLKMWETDDLRDAALVSARISLVSTAFATVLGTASAIALSRYKVRAGSFISVLLLAPILFPGIVLGLALLVAFYKVGLAQSFAGLVAGHTVLTTPFVIRLVMASLAQYDPSYEEAARNLGAGWWRTMFRVTLPLIRPGIMAGAVFAFIISFDELVITMFLAGPNLQTLPIRIFSRIEYSSDPIISAVSTCFLAVWLLVGVPIYTKLLSVGKK